MHLIAHYNSWAFLSVYIQDSVFRLEPHIENGRGKSPYDPKLLTASMLIGEFKTGYAPVQPCMLEEHQIKTWESWVLCFALSFQQI